VDYSFDAVFLLALFLIGLLIVVAVFAGSLYVGLWGLQIILTIGSNLVSAYGRPFNYRSSTGHNTGDVRDRRLGSVNQLERLQQ
jgi:hypothetical protein